MGAQAGRMPEGGVRLALRLPWASPPVTSMQDVVRHELAWLVVASQAVWLLASPQVWPGRAPSVATALAVIVTIGSWLLLLAALLAGDARTTALARRVDLGALLLAAVVAGIQADDADGWVDAASLAILACSAAALLLPWRTAAVVVIGGAVLTARPTTELLPPAGLGGLATPFVPLYVLSAGVALMVVRNGLERTARRRDEAAGRRDAAERSARIAAGVRSELHQRERLLHETVLNTLTAIERGGLSRGPAMVEVLRDRCREAADVLRALARAEVLSAGAAADPGTGPVGLGAELDGYVAGLRAGGLDVTMAVDSLAAVPAHVRRGLVTAVRESLANAARHARAAHVQVLVRVREGDRLAVRAEVRDDGVGFDPTRVRGRFGLSGAITGPMEEVGGSARVESAPGAGTRVLLEWDLPGEPSPEDRWPTALVAPGVVLGLFAAATVLLGWLQFAHPVVTVTDLALALVLGTLVLLAAPEAPLPWPLVVTVSALGPLLTLLERSGGAGLAAGDGWPEASVAALSAVMAAIGPRLGWVALTLAWVLGSGDPLGEALSPATVLILGGAVLGRTLRRDAAALARRRAEAVRAESRLAIDRESVDRVRVRYAALEESAAIGLLEGIVAGTVDPDDPGVREQAGLEESYLRSVMRVDPTADEVRALASRLAALAHGRGTHLRIELGVLPGVQVAVDPRTEESLAAAVTASRAGSTCRLTVRGDGTGVVLTLLAAIDQGERDRMTALDLPGVPTDPGDPDCCDLIWEARLEPGHRG